MKRKIKNFFSVLIILISVVGIIWNVYSYLCMGVIYRYDVYEVHIASTSVLLNTMWKDFSITIIINSFLLFITLLQKLLLKRWDIGRWIYIVCLMVSALSVSLWEYSFRRLFVEFADNCETITSILRSGYYTYIITSVIIISFLLLLDISKKHYSDI